MKTKLIATIVFLIIFLAAFFVGKNGINNIFTFKNSNNNKIESFTPFNQAPNTPGNKNNNILQLVTSVTPTQADWDVIPSVVKSAFINKYGKSAEDYKVKVIEVEGGYAKGSVNSEKGSGVWFSAKANGKWRLVWDGNGIIDCKSIETYPGFPVKIIPSCYDSSKSELVTR